MAGRALAGIGALDRERSKTETVKNSRDPNKHQKNEIGEQATAAQVSPEDSIASITAELRELTSLRDAGILTQQEFEEQKKRLLPS
nr:SHOCT domain-containing protein [Mycobacterium avium]